MKEIDIIDCKYTLLVENGTYYANSILGLLWDVLTHRFEHLMRGDGWMD